MKPLSLEYIVPGDDFTRAGEASSKVKNMLKRVGYDSDSIRRVAIAMYEGEINMVIHAGGGEADIDILPDKVTVVQIAPAVAFIGVITFALSCLGVKLGNVFGAKYKSRAELFGGIVLILMGAKILLEHLLQG